MSWILFVTFFACFFVGSWQLAKVFWELGTVLITILNSSSKDGELNIKSGGLIPCVFIHAVGFWGMICCLVLSA